MSFFNVLYKSCILCLSLICLVTVEAFEPLTMGAAAIGIGAGLTYFKGYTYCRYYECCDDRSIPGNIHGESID